MYAKQLYDQTLWMLYFLFASMNLPQKRQFTGVREKEVSLDAFKSNLTDCIAATV